ncbi:MAG: glycosyltransferase family 9 protein [Alphaproteobacteria bacterium]|nr:glycosyltransferase family 9 protein [Alphaproteobacteria bacterium]
MSHHEEILVIKHGALGDVIIATAMFAAIRGHHPLARIVCLTTKPYAELLSQSPYFDEIWVDSKPRITQRKALKRLKKRLNSVKWDFVYDVQTSQRSTSYWWLFKRPRPFFSGIAKFASHRYKDKARHGRHALDNYRRQLQIAGIDHVGLPDLRWLNAEVRGLVPDVTYVLIVAGGAAHRPEKRWPAEQYAALASELAAKKLVPVLIGGKAEANALQMIADRVPQAINLCGNTTIAQLAVLARSAFMAVGNDTGPMHVIAASRCPSVVLFSGASNPKKSAPPGEHVHCIQRTSLQDLSVDEVLTVIHGLRPLDTTP